VVERLASGPECSVGAFEDAFERLAQIGEQVESISNLDSIRGASCGSTNRGRPTVARDHLDARVFSQPLLHNRGTALGQHIYRSPLLQVD
jgi:hypothetical protein